MNMMCNVAFKNIIRRKKTSILTIVLFTIFFLFMMISFIALKALHQYANDYQNSFYGKEFVINTKYEEIDIQKLKTELEKIEGITDVYTSKERLARTTVTIQNDNIKANIFLHGADNKILPKIISGSKFSNTSDIELICPMRLLNTHVYEYLSEDYLDMQNLINQDLTLSFDEIEQDGLSLQVIATHTYHAKIVGLYDSIANKMNQDECLTNFAFVNELNEITKHITYDQLYITIDQYKHYNSILDRLHTLQQDTGILFSLSPTIELDVEEFNSVLRPILYVFIFSIIISIGTFTLFMIKNKKKREKEIAVYQALGYSKKNMFIILWLENVLLLCFSFVIAWLITFLSFQYLHFVANTKYYNLLLFFISFPTIELFVILILVLLLSWMITKFVFHSNKSISESLKGE